MITNRDDRRRLQVDRPITRTNKGAVARPKTKVGNDVQSSSQT
jgi:hypothetical protein